VRVKGPKGALERTFKGVTFTTEGDTISVVPDDMSRTSRALWGLGRSLLNNMVVGVSAGFQKTLLITGVGYRAQLKGRSINFSLGYSHPILFPLPEGIDAEVPSVTEVTIKGVSKELVGQTSAQIRALRPPEPYKGKGVRYSDEHIRRKAGKAAAAV
jgi:large subunit ribosomal protein L6